MLLAAVGGPKWDTTDPDTPRPEQGLLGPAQGARPVREPAPGHAPIDALLDASPLRREIVEGTDLLVVRELTGGIYFGEKTRDATRASDQCATRVEEVERIARVAFGAARPASRASTRPTCSRPAACGARSCTACTPRSSRTSSSSTRSSTRPR